jgi:hypothetical protein
VGLEVGEVVNMGSVRHPQHTLGGISFLPNVTADYKIDLFEVIWPEALRTKPPTAQDREHEHIGERSREQ